MEGRVALPTPKAFARPHFVQNQDGHAGTFAPALECARVLKKAGFVFEARLKNNVVKDGELLDSLLYAKTN